jgi:hypothetical protein
MKKWLWWIWKGIILMKKGIQCQKNGVRLASARIAYLTRENEWEYKEYEVIQGGSKYKDFEAVNETITLWYILLSWEFWVVKCSIFMYDYFKCIHGCCLWRVHSSKGRWKTHWICSIIIEHNCTSEAVAKTHRNMAFDFAA